MLPILTTIGTGLLWIVGTLDQLVFWGAGISVGFWVGKKITGSWDSWGQSIKDSKAGELAQKIFKRRFGDEEAAIAAATATN